MDARLDIERREGWQVLLQRTETAINGDQNRRMTPWTYPKEERKKKQTSRTIKSSLSLMSVCYLVVVKVESIDYTKRDYHKVIKNKTLS